MKLNAFWLLIFTQTAFASSTFDNVSLEELMNVQVTSITKMPMSLNKSPVTAYVISQDEISRKGYRFLTDILKNTPEFHVVNLSLTEKAITQIFIRGVFANDKITVLVDGIKVKAPAGEPTTFLYAMPLLDVKQVEISLGSASSIYGADAMLGTINLVTENGAGIDGFKMKATGGTRDTGEFQIAAGKKISDDIAVSLTGSFHRTAQEDMKQNYPEFFTNNEKVNLTEQNNNVHFKANYKELTLSYYRVQTINNTNIPAVHPLYYDISGKAFLDSTNQVANATYNLDINPFWQAKSSLSYESNEVGNGSSYGVQKPYSRFSHAMRFSESVAYLNGNVSWLSGIELSFISAQPALNGVKNVSVPHVSYENYAVFSQLTYDLTENLALNGSVRMDADSRYSPTVNPRLGFSWQAMKELRFFGAWGTSYIAPAPYLIYETWGEPTDPVYARPNTALKPERMTTTELGFNLEPFKNNTLKLSGFYTDGKDIIRFADNAFTGKPDFNANLATLTTHGLSISDQQLFDFGLSVDASYTLTKGEQSSLNTPSESMTNAPEHTIVSNLMYNIDKFTARLTGRWFDNIRPHNANSLYKGKMMHGVTLFDANLHYALPLQAAEWSVDLGVNNLFDTKYYEIHVNDDYFGGSPKIPQETRRLYLTLGLSY